ncbi:MAG: carboxypeptidase regulatory-like domain-containing protein [Elusimicrobia bacterium]|nr:carboxypeptidase regulatory-like domain-containing protein [Elusimicrobiota bacterium]
MRERNPRRGGTLTELMVATVILSVGVLGLFGSFRYIARSTFISRATSLATNLGQERIESLKNMSYYALQITTSAGTYTPTDPDILYDTVNYPPETISIGGITFTRYTHVSMAQMYGSNVSTVAPNYPDTGLKQIAVSVVWTEAGQVKSWTLRNLLENPNVNPLDSTITGTVSNSAGGTVASAIVVVEQNENWGATANSAGVYSFTVYHGTYTVRASSAGFNDGISGSVIASRGAVTTANLTLVAVATGSVLGTAWYNNDLVISQVVAATRTIVGDLSEQDVEYIELFNPTTFPINIGTTNQASNKPYALLTGCYNGATFDYHVDNGPGGGSWPFYMVNITSYVAPGRYYLIANATYFYVAGAWAAADAFYTDAAGYAGATKTPATPTLVDYIKDNRPCSVLLYTYGAGIWHDYVGWTDNTGSDPPWYEGVVIPNPAGHDGLGDPKGKQIVRVSSPAVSEANLPLYGRAYDTDRNTRDFLYPSDAFTSFLYPPKSTASGAFTTITGKVPTLTDVTYVTSSDPNSGSTTAFTAYITSGTQSLPYSRFQLSGISTGTWSLTAAYGNYSNTYDNVIVTQGGYTGVPNAVTTPAWPAAGVSQVQLTSSTTTGFVKGTVSNPSAQPINGITVQGGGASKVTGSNGVYFMSVPTGTVTIVANPNNLNPSYVEGIETPSVSAGAVTTKNITLNFGGRITGYVTTGTTPLAYQAITAVNAAGLQIGSGVTDTGGNFTIRNVSTGTCTVYPVLESGQDVMPNTLPANVVSTATIFIGTFTVSGAFGSIAGTVSDASGLVTSGALLLASTNTIASTPSAIVGSSAPAQVPMYMVSSKADGTYTLPVRGGATYYLSAYVPVISGTGVTITTKTYSGIIVSPSAATTKNVTIP